jgi:hypothetical protein
MSDQPSVISEPRPQSTADAIATRLNMEIARVGHWQKQTEDWCQNTLECSPQHKAMVVQTFRQLYGEIVRLKQMLSMDQLVLARDMQPDGKSDPSLAQ